MSNGLEKERWKKNKRIKRLCYLNPNDVYHLLGEAVCFSPEGNIELVYNVWKDGLHGEYFSYTINNPCKKFYLHGYRVEGFPFLKEKPERLLHRSKRTRLETLEM